MGDFSDGFGPKDPLTIKARERALKLKRENKNKERNEFRELVNSAYERAQEELDDAKIDPADFVLVESKGNEREHGVYPQESIDKDQKEVERLNGIFNKDVGMNWSGTILEAIMLDQIEMNGWLGDDDINVYKTSDFDDYINKVDIYMEFMREESASFLGLGIDTTLNPTKIETKLKYFLDSALSKTMGEIKYFECDGFKGRKSRIPLVVIGTTREEVVELSKLWMDRKNSELQKHPVSKLIIDQSISQLKFYHKLFTKLDMEEQKRVDVGWKYIEDTDEISFGGLADIVYRQLMVLESISDEKTKKGVEAPVNHPISKEIESFIKDIDGVSSSDLYNVALKYWALRRT